MSDLGHRFLWINVCRGLLCLSLRFATQSVGPRLAKSLVCFSSSPLQDFTSVWGCFAPQKCL